ncbi:putative reverse transcriptase domain-containing protein [Tanacetum coccineum]
MAVEETLRVFSQWLCGKCMTLDVVNHACHHSHGHVCFSKGSDDMSRYIVGISTPCNKECETKVTEGLVLDAKLLDRVFNMRITIVKCFPHGCWLAFYQALKIVLCNLVTQPDSVDAWFRLLLFHDFYHEVTGCMRGKDDGTTMKVKSMLDTGLGSLCKGRTTSNTNIRQRLHKVADGYFTAAVKVLPSSNVTSYCDDTIKALEAKHPYKPPPSMSSNTFSEPPILVEIDSVFGCIKSFPKATSCGRDGLRAHHILNALCGEGSATATSLKGHHLNRKEILKYLSDVQFRVEVSGGIDVLLHNRNRVLSEYHNDGSLAMLTVDFSNAFKLVDRSALFHEETHIFGLPLRVQQGKPLGPLLFAIVLHPLVHKIKDSCKLLLHALYLDDVTIILDSKEVVMVLDIIRLREGLFPADIWMSSLGVKLLGRAVNRDAYFISGLAMRRAVNAVDLLSLLFWFKDLSTFTHGGCGHVL